jgi:hypothetical protein
MRVGLVLAAFGLFAATAAANSTQPRLVLRSGTPVVVHGAGFKAKEHVNVLVNGPKLWRRTVTADSSGRFILKLPLVFRLGKCNGFAVTARAESGARAFEGMGGTNCSAPGITIPSAGD